MNKDKPALERLEEFGPYKDFQKRRTVALKFFEEIEDTAINKVFDGSLEPAIALLITFMEWQEKLMVKLDETPEG